MGVARKIAEINGIINYPQVRETLGLLAAKATNIEALVIAMESAGEQYGEYFVPNRAILATAQVVAQQLYPEVIDALRTLAGGGLIMLPSSAHDFRHPVMAAAIEKTQRSSVADPQERVKFFKLAWDIVGSEFGSRHLQYEMFYSGPTFVTRGHSYRFYDWQQAKGMVEGLMAGYDLPPSTRAGDKSSNR
jgi:4-hydroxyphenylacetate 3-monooxygenase